MGRLTDAFKNAKTSKLLSASDIVAYAKNHGLEADNSQPSLKIFILGWATINLIFNRIILSFIKNVVYLHQNCNYMKKRINTTFMTLVMLLFGYSTIVVAQSGNVVSSGFPELDEWVSKCKVERPNALGYPGNYDGKLDSFYAWYAENKMENVLINNAGDPFENPSALSSLKFEREVIESFAPLYGFDLDNVWGLVTMSGTDGNNHGLYFGVNYLKKKTGKMPIAYVSDEAHYSNYRLCDVQNLEVRMIKSNEMGQMIPEEFEKVLDPTRPCLMIYAMGSTFKGAIDDQLELNKIIDKYPEMEVYRHIDAALFGGYLPFTEYKMLVNQKAANYQSISISGHKFFGIDSPCGLFITTREVYDNQASFDVAYLNANMRMINCSRSGVEPLKFWWLLKTVGIEGWTEQAAAIMENTAYLVSELTRIGWPCWNNKYSNTVFFKRPNSEIVSKFNLANSYDERFGGDLSHVVVMQHVKKEVIDKFIAELEATIIIPKN